jgi:uncharacterized membrane protein
MSLRPSVITARGANYSNGEKSVWLHFRRTGGNISRERRFYSLEVIDMAVALLRVNPFDLRTVLLARHAQHVVLIHFPIALFITAVAFDAVAHWTRRQALAEAAYYNLLLAAISTPVVLATGLLAWHFQLEGQKLKGVLLQHLVLACASSALIALAWWLHFRMRQRVRVLPRSRFAIEVLAVGIIAVTAHLGGFLSGVNRPG